MLFKRYILTLAAIVTCFSYQAQICETGSLYVTGSGCGCLSGCNLTSVNGPNCGSGTSGNCSGGYLLMSTTFDVPDGCEVRVTAEMRTRPGCSASGADGNSPTRDRLRVRNTAGATPPWQIGGSNASISDQITVTGPATILIEGAANRSDEIISYEIEDIGSCNCSQILPVELIEFSGISRPNHVNLLQWTTAVEINNDYFTLERSTDAVKFNPIATIDGAGNATEINMYHFFDAIGKNAPKTYYYRLKQTDFDGKSEYFKIIALNNDVNNEISAFYNENKLHVNTRSSSKISIFDMAGKEILSSKGTFNQPIDLSFLTKGLYIYRLQSETGSVTTDKFFVN